MQRLYLVRHGATAWNVDRRYMGQADIPLNELGWQQVDELARYLARVDFIAAYTSDLQRARQTAGQIVRSRALTLSLDRRLREADFGAWQGLTFEQASQQYPDEMRAWIENPVEAKPPGGESLAALQQRVSLAAYEVCSRLPSGNILFVTHGGPAQALLSNALKMPLSAFWRIKLDNGGIAVLDYYDQEGILSAVHQPPLLTESQ